VMNLCLPAVVLNAILRRLIAEGDRPRRRSKEAQARMRQLMGEAKIGALLQFPPMRLRASDLAALVPGAILRLPLARHSSSELRVGGLTLGRAHPVQTGEHRGAQMVGSREVEDLELSVGSSAVSESVSVN
jgi:flagellar motor switch protein FliM